MNTTRMILGLATLAMLGGCVKTSTTSTGMINSEPLTIDPAMQLRDWQPSVAYYANGDTMSGSTGFAYEPDPKLDSWQYYFADPGTYFVNLVTSPYTLYEQRDGVGSTGVSLPPTYTAVPPLPPSYAKTVTTAPTTAPK